VSIAEYFEDKLDLLVESEDVVVPKYVIIK